MTCVFSAEKLTAVAPLAQCKVSVIIPVRDEARHLDATLTAATQQVDLENRPLDPRSYEIIILANNCRDESAAIARKWSDRDKFPPVHVAEINLPRGEAHVGRARRILMDEAHRRLSGSVGRNGVIASTDGDTRVAPNWLAATLAEIGRGADAVGGRIIVEKSEQALLTASAHRYHLQDSVYSLLVAELEHLLDPVSHDPYPRHHQHFGASFAVTTEIYSRSGGLPPVHPLEDVAFFDLLQRMDARFRHSPQVRVQTSARTSGRVAVGLSWQLGRWAKMSRTNRLPLVASAREMASWFRVRQTLRKFWESVRAENHLNESAMAVFARQTGVGIKFLRRRIYESRTFGTLAGAMWLEIKENTDWNEHFPLSDIRRATADLRSMLEVLRVTGNASRAFQTHRDGTYLPADLKDVASRPPSLVERNREPRRRFADNRGLSASSGPE